MTRNQIETLIGKGRVQKNNYLPWFGSGYWPSKMVYSQGCSTALEVTKIGVFGHGLLIVFVLTSSRQVGSHSQTVINCLI